MSTNKAVPEGLKNQECEKGNRKKRPPIPYVLVSYEVQEAVSKGKDFSYKIKLPDKTEFSVPIWDTGTQEAFLIHVQQAKSACKRKGLFLNHDFATSLELSHTPNFPKIHPHLQRHISIRVHPHVHPQHIKVQKHFACI